MTKNKKAEEIAFSRCDVPERTKRFALQYVSEAYAGIKNCRECEFYNTCDRIDSVRAELRKKKKEGMKNMTEQETREKIFNIIREFNVKKRRYSTHTEPSDDDELADALIAAGIGDVSELKKHRVIVEQSPVPTDDNCYILPNTSPIIKQLYSGKEVEQIAKERDEYKHRAERAERAFSKLVHEMYEHGIRPMCDEKFFVESRLKDAAKELAEEGKDD